jgi:hypothetical protein
MRGVKILKGNEAAFPLESQDVRLRKFDPLTVCQFNCIDLGRRPHWKSNCAVSLVLQKNLCWRKVRFGMPFAESMIPLAFYIRHRSFGLQRIPEFTGTPSAPLSQAERTLTLGLILHSSLTVAQNQVLSSQLLDIFLV